MSFCNRGTALAARGFVTWGGVFFWGRPGGGGRTGRFFWGWRPPPPPPPPPPPRKRALGRLSGAWAPWTKRPGPGARRRSLDLYEQVGRAARAEPAGGDEVLARVAGAGE